MTELTRDEVCGYLAMAEDGYPIQFPADAIRDLARLCLSLMDRLADADMAQAALVERASRAFPDDIEVYRLIKKARARRHGEIAKFVGDYLLQIADNIRALAPDAGVKAVAELRRELAALKAAK